MESNIKRKRDSPLLKEFRTNRKRYEEFTEKIENLVTILLREKNFNVLSVTSRTKTLDSLKNKISNEAKHYKKLSDIDDLTGIRIICFFSDDVDKVAEIINSDFKVIKDRSVDKRKLLEPDRFGYISLHNIVELSDNRSELPEYQRFQGLRCEVQIRSILQHAWAEIEHDLGYKSSIGIPNEIKRKFSRQAGILELADEQFVDIKKDILKYRKEIQTKISHSYKNIFIDNISINNYLDRSETVYRIDLRIASETKNKTSNTIQLFRIEQIIKICQYFKIKTIDELEILLMKNEDQIISIAKTIDLNSAIDRGDSIWFLGYSLSAKTHNIDTIENYINYMSISSSNEDEDEIVFRREFTKQILQGLS
jgi:putative GTP pyrophosphokinase